MAELDSSRLSVHGMELGKGRKLLGATARLMRRGSVFNPLLVGATLRRSSTEMRKKKHNQLRFERLEDRRVLTADCGLGMMPTDFAEPVVQDVQPAEEEYTCEEFAPIECSFEIPELAAESTSTDSGTPLPCGGELSEDISETSGDAEDVRTDVAAGTTDDDDSAANSGISNDWKIAGF